MTRPTTLLVVDDQEAGRYVKAQTLRRAGFNVIEGATGKDALELASRERPDLVVLDVNLPDIHGLEVTRRLRESESGPPALPILQISNTAVESADRVRGLEHGADVYLTEPIDSAVLVATVHALLRVRRAEAALATALEGERHARAEAEQANRLKDEFIATLSHELRTPLNALLGWIWQLRNSTLEPPARERALDSIERNARLQAQLINDLLDVSRASRGKLQLEFRIVDLEKVIAAACDSVRDSITGKDLELRAELSSIYVAGDQARLQQVVTNLLTNAVQFTAPGGRISVTLSADDDGFATVAVQDTGAGIDPAFLPHVFEQFRQGDGGLSRKHGGLGLGLSVVKQLVELHGGTVAVSSPGPGQGTTFIARLPRETVAPDAPDEAASKLLLQDMRVLVVTDGSAESAAIASILESSGAVVTVRNVAPGSPAPSSADDCDVIVRDLGGEPLAFRAPALLAPDLDWHVLSRSAQPGHVVRRIAQVTTHTRTS